MKEQTMKDKDGKNRLCVEISCEQCGVNFWKNKNQWRRMNHHFCSKSCHYEFRSNKKELLCGFCGKEFKRTKARCETKTGFNFCSRDCKDKGQRLDSGLNGFHPEHYKGDFSRARNYTKEIGKCQHDNCDFSYIPLLQLHHKDGNRSNNSVENFIVLCPNHHQMRHLRIKKNGDVVIDYKYITTDEELKKIQAELI